MERSNRERTRAGLESARRRGRKGGRPLKFTAAKREKAQKLLKNPDMDVRDVAKLLGVSLSTLYAHMPGAKMTALESARERGKMGEV